MSFTSRLNSLFWNSLLRLRSQHTFKTITKTPRSNIIFPATLSFSIFTWLGFDNKVNTPEDDLINAIKYSVLFIQRNEYDKAERLLHVTLRQAQMLHNQLGVTYIYDVMANLALQRNQLDKAKSLFVSVAQRLMADGATEDDLNFIQISIKLARISHLKKEFDVAKLGFDWCMKKLEAALNKDTTSDGIQLMAITEDWYGRLLLDTNELENGLNMMKKALERMRKLESVDMEHIVVQLNDLGTVCERVDRLDDSIAYIKEAIKHGETIDDMDDLGIMYVNLGRLYLKKKMFDEARKNCGYGWKLAKDTKNTEIKNEAAACIKEVRSMS